MRKRRYGYLALILTILLGTHKGYLALWRSGEAAPLRVYPLSIATLPQADRVLLERGIPVTDGRHLAGLLEDYLS